MSPNDQSLDRTMKRKMARISETFLVDEQISMAIGDSESTVVDGPVWKYVLRKGTVTVVGYRGGMEGASFVKELENFTDQLAGLDQSLKKVVMLWDLVSEELEQREKVEDVLREREFTELVDERFVRRMDLLGSNGSESAILEDSEGIVKDGIQLVQVKTSDVADWEARINIENTVFGYPSGSYLDRLRIALKVMAPLGDAHWIAKEAGSKAGDGVVAYLTMRYRHGLAYLQGAGILPSHRRKGITRRMLEAAVVDARRKGFKEIVTIAWDDDAEKAWTAMGFTETVGKKRKLVLEI